MKTSHHQHYFDRMKSWRFVKDTDPKPHREYAIGGLGYRSDNTLKQVASLNIGESLHIYDYKLTRIQ